MKTTIIIPKKIKVGFNPRTDTYTGMLGYVIYHDGKVWRKETSWEGWRYKFMDPAEYENKKRQQYEDRIKQQTTYYNQYLNKPKRDSYEQKYVDMGLDGYLQQFVGKSYEEFRPNLGQVSSDEKIKPVEFTNEPLDGFVLNRKAGGYASGWNHRQTYCRVYDPRGFEFEITIPNLLYILENANSFVGKGLEGKFIYGWDGKDLVLVPENAPEFKEMVKFTELLTKKVSKKELKLGGIYTTSQNRKVVYLEENYSYGYNGRKSDDKVLWFYDVEGEYRHITSLSITSIKEYSGEVDSEYASYMELLYTTESHTPKKIAEVTYVPYTIHDLNKMKDYSYYNDPTVFILEKGKYVKRYIIKKYGINNYRDYVYALSKKRNTKNYDNLEFMSSTKLFESISMYKEVISTEKEYAI